MTTGERVRHLRRARGWSQATLAAMANYSAQHVSAAACGRERSERLWCALARALGVTREDLASDPATERAVDALVKRDA